MLKMSKVKIVVLYLKDGGIFNGIIEESDRYQLLIHRRFGEKWFLTGIPWLNINFIEYVDDNDGFVASFKKTIKEKDNNGRSNGIREKILS